MRPISKWLLASITMLILLISLPTKQVKAQEGNVSFQMFYDELSPYGQWIDDPQYGYVWSPDVDQDFRPYYSDGRWVMTEYGNTWVSNYDWGWAPFHYGRWTFDNYYGWLWIPGYEWGPAWVDWRSGGGYYGWAPLGPGFSISMGNYDAPFDWWIFIPCRYIYSYDYYAYWRGPRYNNTFFGNTHYLNNYYHNNYVYGPRRDDIAHYTGGKVPTYNIRNDKGPRRTSITKNDITIYRPQINKEKTNAAPRNVIRPDRFIGNGDKNNSENIRDNNRNLHQNNDKVINMPSRNQNNNIKNQNNVNQLRNQQEQINRDNNIRQQQNQPRNQNQYIQPQQPQYQNNAEPARQWKRPEPQQQPQSQPQRVQPQRVQPQAQPRVQPNENTRPTPNMQRATPRTDNGGGREPRRGRE